jgi:hypothetical protein
MNLSGYTIIPLRQKCLGARWFKKSGVNNIGQKNSLYIDIEHSFISRYSVAPVNVLRSQML